jgi:DNA-binding NtrC family response regulator
MTTICDGTILLIDDDNAMRDVIARSFRAFGYFVYEYSNAEAAVEFLRSHLGPIDLLVTDMMLPGMGGSEAVRNAQLLRPGLPVIRISGWPSYSASYDETEDDDFFLAKPFRLEQLGRYARAMIQAS